MADEETLRTYSRWAAKYADRYGRKAPDEELLAFMAALPENAHVLDLGCGIGRATANMIDAGFTVDAVDATPEFAAIARDSFNVDIRIATFDDIDAVAAYDGVHAHFSLQHTAKSELPGNLARIARALKPAGMFHIAVTRGTGEKRDGLGRFYAYYSDKEVAQLLAEAGFAVTRRWFGESKGMDGEIAPWIVLHARKTA